MEKEITLAAKIENLTAVTALVDETLEELDCSMKVQMQLDVAIDELFGNIARYAYAPGTGEVTVRLSFEEETRMFSLTFRDEGVPFDPLSKANPDITLSAEERDVGGLGIFLVKKTMDEMAYRRDGSFNELTIRKKIEGGGF